MKTSDALTSAWKMSAKVVLALIIFIVLLSLVGATYQAIGYWRDSRDFAQRGRSVRVGHIKLNVKCIGNGLPTVVLESGLGVRRWTGYVFSQRSRNSRAFVRMIVLVTVGVMRHQPHVRALKSQKN
jgi:hypothetical protein